MLIPEVLFFGALFGALFWAICRTPQPYDRPRRDHAAGDCAPGFLGALLAFVVGWIVADWWFGD